MTTNDSLKKEISVPFQTDLSLEKWNADALLLGGEGERDYWEVIDKFYFRPIPANTLLGGRKRQGAHNPPGSLTPSIGLCLPSDQWARSAFIPQETSASWPRIPIRPAQPAFQPRAANSIISWPGPPATFRPVAHRPISDPARLSPSERQPRRPGSASSPIILHGPSAWLVTSRPDALCLIGHTR